MYLLKTSNNHYNCFYCNFKTKLKFNLEKHFNTKNHLEKMRSIILSN